MTEELYRHRMTGDLARRTGDTIKLDRPAALAQPFRENEWVREMAADEFTQSMALHIAHAADQKVAFYLGEMVESRRDWKALTEKERDAFASRGPPKGPRRAVYDAIRKALVPYLSKGK